MMSGLRPMRSDKGPITRLEKTPPRTIDEVMALTASENVRGTSSNASGWTPPTGAFDELAGHLSCQSGFPCAFRQNQAHRLFDFIDANGREIITPFFLEYTTGWLDDSTFAITVINGTKLLRPGIVAESWNPPGGYALNSGHDWTLNSALADAGTRVAIRAGITIQSLSCPPAYIGTPYCTVPTGLAVTDETSPSYGYEAPHLRGDFGRITGPEIVGFSADDPDNGDDIFGDGDVLNAVLAVRYCTVNVWTSLCAAELCGGVVGD